MNDFNVLPGKVSSFGLVLAIVIAFLLPSDMLAQRGGHSRGGGGAAPRTAPARTPSTKPTINGGSQRAPERPKVNNSGGNSSGNRSNGSLGNGTGNTNGMGNAGAGGNGRGGGNTSISGGNKTNIGSGNTNVNINVDKSTHINNSHNTTVRHNTNVHYNRPPYHYGGHRYYCYHPYHYHPYRPFYWGPVWHPWGFFVATMATTAIIVSVNNAQYHYDQGVYYAPSNGGYVVVAAPVGATITTLPTNYETVTVNETTNNYYYGGTYYEKSAEGYTVVPPTAGCVVENLPEGGEEVKVGDQTYVKVGETYYSPIEKNGKNLYEVVDVQDDAEDK